MREIQFKAYHIPTKRMFYVSSWHKNFLFEGSEDGVWSSLTFPIERKDCVLMQFIGLYDINGKKIFEGDIICSYRLDGIYRMYKIFWRKGGFVFNDNQDDFKKPIEQILFTESCSDMQNAGFLETCEIIGNIYENPELL